jgi:phosphatidylglycerophosphatase A
MSVLDRLRFLLVTSCGLGLAPVAPGTFGTLGGVVLAVLLQVSTPEHWLAGAWITAAALFVLGCMQSKFTARTFPREDPGQFVLDEVVGYLVTVALYSSLSGKAPDGFAHMGAFFAFRAFDVLKLQPAKKLEDLPGAFGIMADDVAAGVYAGLVLWIGLPLIGR